MFVWSAFKNILPIAVELRRRHISSNPFCIHCKTKIETTAHVLMECRGLRDLWWSEFQVSQVDIHDSPLKLFKRLMKELSRDDLLVEMVVWSKTWEIRNTEVHGGDIRAPPDLVTWAREFLVVYHTSQLKPTPTTTENLLNIWIPPDPGCMKINVDVAFPEGVDFI